jgi:hypothetical protein
VYREYRALWRAVLPHPPRLHQLRVAGRGCCVVETLEGHGVKCWIAPRDVVPGALYADEIVRAINEARVVVLILSEQAVASPHVGKEIERASSKRRRTVASDVECR